MEQMVLEGPWGFGMGFWPTFTHKINVHQTSHRPFALLSNRFASSKNGSTSSIYRHSLRGLGFCILEPRVLLAFTLLIGSGRTGESATFTTLVVSPRCAERPTFSIFKRAAREGRGAKTVDYSLPNSSACLKRIVSQTQGSLKRMQFRTAKRLQMQFERAPSNRRLQSPKRRPLSNARKCSLGDCNPRKSHAFGKGSPKLHAFGRGLRLGEQFGRL